MIKNQCPEVVDRKKFNNNKECEQLRKHEINCYLTNPCHNFGQLYLTALCNQKYSEVLKFQISENLYKKYIDEFYNTFSNEFDPKKLGQKLEEFKSILAYSDVEFLNLDLNENKCEKIIEKLQSAMINNKILFYTEGIPSEFNYPLEVLHHVNYKIDNKYLKIIAHKYKTKCKDCQTLNQVISCELHNYFKLKFILGSKNCIPVLLLFNEDHVIEICQEKKKIIISNKELSESIDIIYALYYSI